MNHTEEYSDQELQDMKERCLYIITNCTLGKDYYDAVWSAIYKIALVEINRVLDERKIERQEQNE